MAIGGEHEVFSIPREHRKGVEDGVESDLFEARAVDVDHVDIKLESPFGGVVGGEEDAFAVGVEIRSPVGFAEVGDLSEARTVGIDDEDFHFGGLYETLSEQSFVFVDFFRGGWAGGTEDDLFAVGGEKGTSVVTEGVGELANVVAVDVHDEEFEITRAHRGKDDFVSLRRDGGFGVVAGRVGELFDDAPLEISYVDVVILVDGPDVLSVGALWHGRAGVAALVGRSVKDEGVARQEKGTGGAPLARADHLRAIAPRVVVDAHDEDLIALDAPHFVVGLEDELGIVKTKVGLCVVAAKGELANIAQVLFAGISQAVFGHCSLCGGGSLVFCSLFTTCDGDHHSDDGEKIEECHLLHG